MAERGSDRLPSGATLDSAEADAIAKDPDRAKAALAFWRGALEALDSSPFASAEPQAHKVFRAVPNVRFDLSRDFELSRPSLLPPGDTIESSGCGISGAELARFLRVGRSLDDVVRAAKELEAAANNVAPRRDAGACVRACRELHDAARRLASARQRAIAGRLTHAESLALHRIEGGFAVTPDNRSFAHAPLTRTVVDTCRTPKVTISSLPGADNIERPGFNLVMRLLGVRTNDANIVSRPLLLVVNTLVLGGLDILVSSAAQPDPARDELAALVVAALQPEGPLGKDSTARDFAALPILSRFVAGVAMIELERATRLPDDVEGFIERVRARLGRLVAAHNADVGAAAASASDVKISTDDARDLTVIGELQADWYGSRTDPQTLRPWNARSESVGPRLNFSPYVAYLRFNVGDASFVTTLLRTAVQLGALDRFWRANRRRDVPVDLPAALQSITGPPTPRARAALQRLLDEWTSLSPQRKKTDQHAWKVTGLIRTLQQGTRYPRWAPRSPPPDSAQQAVVASCVSRVMDTLDIHQLLPAIGIALEWTPFDEIQRLGIPTDAAGFRRAHSFARLTIVYQRALAEAGFVPDLLRRW